MAGAAALFTCRWCPPWHVPCAGPLGATVQVNSRPDRRQPVHVHAASPFSEQRTLSILNPWLLAITRALPAAC